MTIPAQNRAEAAPAKKRVVGRPFEPGNRANPGGRPRGLASAIREKVPASELAEHFMAIWTRDRKALARLKIPLNQVTLAERNKAAEWLSDHGYGKAPQFAPVEGGDPLDRDEADQALAEVADELAARRHAHGDRDDDGASDNEATGVGAAPDRAVASAGAD